MSSRSQRRRPLDHYLVAGGPEDIAAIRAFLAMLPATAYGQVLLAEDSDGSGSSDACAQVVAPARMSVTRLGATDTSDTGWASALATRGRVLAEAVTAWVQEWIPTEPTADRVVSLWIGGRGVPALDALCEELPESQRL